MNEKIPEQYHPKVMVTFHAEKRAQQRGILKSSIILAAIYGKKGRVPAGWQRVFTGKSAKRAKRDGVAASYIEAAIGTPVICDESLEGNRSVITVLKKITYEKQVKRGDIGTEEI